MIDHLTGTISHSHEQEITLDLAIVGITLQVPSSQTFPVGSQAKVLCHLHWNSENGPSLFGFATPLDRSVFRVVISCSGIGPKIALAIIADLGSSTFLHAIATGDDQTLSKVNGIGKKKAEQIAVQLKHKVAALLETGIIVEDIQSMSHVHDVSQALQSLNYSRQEISRVMDYLKKNSTLKNESFDYLLRQALSFLSKQL